jgi:hypothetical protein
LCDAEALPSSTTSNPRSAAHIAAEQPVGADHDVDLARRDVGDTTSCSSASTNRDSMRTVTG